MEEAHCFREALRLLCLPPPSQGTPRGREEGLYLQEARGARYVATQSQPTGAGRGGRHGAGRRGPLGRATEFNVPQPGPGPAASRKAKKQREVARGVFLPTYTDRFLCDPCAPFVDEETEAL